MKLNNKRVVITGGARGIGKALAIRFAARGAQIVVADRLFDVAQQTAAKIDGLAVACDVTKESDIQRLVLKAREYFGDIDLFCSNAGLFYGEPSHAASASNEQWQTCWDVHVMAQVYAARAVLPRMIENGNGYLLNVASAAGLLSQIGDAAYSTTKHAAIGFAESLAITHKDDGIKVSVLCPQYVATPMLGYDDHADVSHAEGLITPEQLADVVVQGIEAEQFLILPHPEVEKYMQFKTADYDRWLGGMRKLRRKVKNDDGTINLKDMHTRV